MCTWDKHHVVTDHWFSTCLGCSLSITNIWHLSVPGDYGDVPLVLGTVTAVTVKSGTGAAVSATQDTQKCINSIVMRLNFSTVTSAFSYRIDRKPICKLQYYESRFI